MYKDFKEWVKQYDPKENFDGEDLFVLANAWDASATRFEGVVKALDRFFVLFDEHNSDDNPILPCSVCMTSLSNIRAALKDLKGPDNANGVTDKTSPIIAK